jgi:glutaredoxin
MKIQILNLSVAATLIFFTSLAEARQTLASEPLNPQQLKTNLLLANNVNRPLKNSSGAAEIGLAKHLKKIKAKMYGAFWCPYCTKQKEMFGKEAFPLVTYIECDPRGENPRPDLCTKAGVQGFPTWEIKGKIYSGMLPLDDLANISDYKGARNFKN